MHSLNIGGIQLVNQFLGRGREKEQVLKILSPITDSTDALHDREHY